MVHLGRELRFGAGMGDVCREFAPREQLEGGRFPKPPLKARRTHHPERYGLNLALCAEFDDFVLLKIIIKSLRLV